MTQKIAIWAPSHNFVRLYLRNWGMYRQLEKKLVKQQYLLHVPTIWWTSAYYWLRSFREFGAPQLLSTASASWQRYCTAVSSQRQPNCGGEQRVPPMFGRATITLGIGPHFYFYLNKDSPTTKSKPNPNPNHHRNFTNPTLLTLLTVTIDRWWGKSVVLDCHWRFLTENEIENANFFDASIFSPIY